MNVSEILTEGGWASASTQDTIITPQTIADAIPVMQQFQDSLNKHLTSDGLQPIKIGNPVGSGTYYKRDLVNNPDKEYGDIDVQFIMPRGDGGSTNQVQGTYFESIKEFCRMNANFETDNGKNVIFQIGPDFIQVDLVAIFDDRVEFTKALAPEHGTKGVLSGSLYSALAQALDISISDAGIQGKTVDGKLVSYRKAKGTTLNLISSDHKNWAVDIAKFFGAKKASPILKQYPGTKDEVRIQDIVNSFKGIAQTLEMNGVLPAKYSSAAELLQEIKAIYLGKISAIAGSSKFDKAESASAKKKAQDTKDMLTKRSSEIAQLF
jgi:hypothetical protein